MPLNVLNGSRARIEQLIKDLRQEVEIEFGTSGAAIPNWYGSGVTLIYAGKSLSRESKNGAQGYSLQVALMAIWQMLPL